MTDQQQQQQTPQHLLTNIKVIFSIASKEENNQRYWVLKDDLLEYRAVIFWYVCTKEESPLTIYGFVLGPFHLRILNLNKLFTYTK